MSVCTCVRVCVCVCVCVKEGGGDKERGVGGGMFLCVSILKLSPFQAVERMLCWAQNCCEFVVLQ